MPAQPARTRAAVARSADLETRATRDDHASLRLWLRMLSCTNLIESRVRQNLQLRFGTSLARFDLLAQLARAPDGLKMGELSRRMMVTGGSVTGTVDQLEAEGHVVRAADRNDRRALLVRLTPAGRRAFQRMAVEHERWIRELFAGLGEREQRDLGRLLLGLKAYVQKSNGKETKP